MRISKLGLTALDQKPSAIGVKDLKQYPSYLAFIGASPGTGGDNDEEGKSYWFAGSVWDRTDDQLPRFLEQGVWENGYDDQFLDIVRRIKPGDQIAIKASFVKKRVPFDVGGKPVSVMRIKATGTVLDNAGDGRTVKVAWDPPAEPRDWYFYTYRTTIVEADTETEDGRRLVDFTFRGAPQDYTWWLAQPYWLEKYGVKPESISVDAPAEPIAIEDEEIGEEESPYAIEDIIADGCFLTSGELEEILVPLAFEDESYPPRPTWHGKNLAGEAPRVCTRWLQ